MWQLSRKKNYNDACIFVLVLYHSNKIWSPWLQTKISYSCSHQWGNNHAFVKYTIKAAGGGIYDCWKGGGQSQSPSFLGGPGMPLEIV